MTSGFNGGDNQHGSAGVPLAVSVPELRDLRAQAEAIVHSSRDAIVGKDLNGIVTTWNAGAERLFGYTAEEMVGRSIMTIIPQDRRNEEAEILAKLGRGEEIDHFDTVRKRKDGGLVAVSLTVSPIRDVRGRIIGASKFARDITERKRQEEYLVFLMGEMSHRINNLLTIVHAMAQQSARSSGDLQEFMNRFSGRILGLAYSNRLLVEQNWRGVALDKLVRSQLRPFAEEDSARIDVEGPRVTLAIGAVQSVGLALHELATNAAKYGALSVDGGKVRVRWELFSREGEVGEQDNLLFRLDWRESGGPPVVVPSRKGFGSSVLNQMTRSALACETNSEFATTGLRWTLICPANRILKLGPTRTDE